MADLYEPDVGTAYYRSADPVKNLKISVKIDRITSSSLVPKPTEVLGRLPAADDVELKDLTKQGMKDKEEMVISWQEKIFSQRELELYNIEDNCFSPVEKKYHNEVKAILAKSKPGNRIFTYVDHDKFSQEDEATEYLTTSPNERPTFLTEKMTHMRRRRVGMGKQKRDRDHTFVPKLNVIEDDPSEELISKNHLTLAPMQVMHIMADLSPRDRMATEEEEVVLCTIKVDANGVLSIHPDFNRGRKAYVKETQKEFGRARTTRTLCEQRRIQSMISMIVYQGQWFPKCDADGLFLPEQCNNIGQCFCVDVNTGVVDESSKVQGSANC